jgi:ornithine cyclodeaminase
VLLWNRDVRKAEALQKQLAHTLPNLAIAATPDLEKAARQADLISCATLSKTPLVKGDWLKPGAHLDLVGGFTPEMRETDDLAVRKARVFADTRAGALKEAGDLVDPIKRGIIGEADVQADLFDLCRGKQRGRLTPEEITLFKSVGTALEDLAAAELLVERLGTKPA